MKMKKAREQLSDTSLQEFEHTKVEERRKRSRLDELQVEDMEEQEDELPR